MLLIRNKINTIFSSPLIMLFTLIVPILISIKGSGYKPTSFSEIAITVLVYLILILSFTKRLSQAQSIFCLTLLSYLAVQICLSLISNSILAAFESLILHNRYIPVSVIVFNLLNLKKQRVLTDLLIIMGVLLAWLTVIKVLQNPTMLFTLYAASEGGYQRQGSIFPNTNMAGTYFTIILILFLPRIPVNKWYKTAVTYIMAGFPLLLSVMLSFSRRAWLFLLIAVSLQFILGKRKIKFVEWLLMLVIIFALSQIDFVSIIGRFLLIFDGGYESNSLRAASSGQFYKFLSRSPELFLGGGGVGRYGPASISISGDKYRQIDVYYSQLHLEFGLIGLLGYLGVFSVVFCTAIYCYMKHKIVEEYRDVYLAYILAFLGLYFFALAGSTPITYPLSFFQWYIAGVLLSRGYKVS